MDTDKIKIFGARVKVDSTGKLAELEKAEREKMRAKVEKIKAHGINCFVNRQLIYNWPEQLFADAGIVSIDQRDGIERHTHDGHGANNVHNSHDNRQGDNCRGEQRAKQNRRYDKDDTHRRAQQGRRKRDNGGILIKEDIKHAVREYLQPSTSADVFRDPPSRGIRFDEVLLTAKW